MKHIAVILGTRPDAIKLAPVVRELQRRNDRFRTSVIATGQHRQMLDQVFEIFGITPDTDLDVMTTRQTLAGNASRMLSGLDEALGREERDLVVVQGDTTTTFVGSLAAYYRKIPVAHVEAGLRTNERYSPFPEEMNRRLTSELTDLHFAPTHGARAALQREGIATQSIFVTGNTVIDALLSCVKTAAEPSDAALRHILDGGPARGRRLVLITAHRRENWGEPMHRISAAIRALSETHADVDFLFPVHLNPVVREIVEPALSGLPNVFLIDPLDYGAFAHVMNRSHLVITDSGGVQEEAPALGKPVLVMRESTERPEAVDAGVACLVGTDPEKITREANRLLTDPARYREMARGASPYGDGRAAQRIVDAISFFFGMQCAAPEDFAA